MDLGESQLPRVLVHSQYQEPCGYAYFCPECCRIWARILVPGQHHQAITVKCERHPPSSPFDFPGSLWLSWRSEVVQAFPRAVLEREFILHLNHYDRFAHDSRY